MKKNLWLLCGLMVSTSLLAQQATTSPAAPVETPAPAPAATAPAGAESATPTAPAMTNAPAAKAAKKSAGKKKSGKKSSVAKKESAVAKKAAAPRKAVAPVELKTTPLTPGSATVAANNVNVRGQAKLKSEVIGHVTKGQTVTVVEEVVLNNSAPDEPSAWAKILLPAGIHTWVNGTFIDPANKSVKATRLNLRSGPGENYSVLGRVEHGETVKDIGTKGDWMEIEAPTNAFAFVAAQFLKQEEPTAPTPTPAVATTTTTTTTPTTPPPTTPTATEITTTTNPAPATTSAPTVAETKPVPPAPETTTVAANPPVAPPTTTENPTPTPAPVETPAVTNVTAAATAPAVETPAPEAKPEEPPPPRIVLREGIVRGMTSIQAPTHFELISPATGKTIDYLYTTSKDLDLRRYKGLRIVVAGEEGLDERWGNTPVLTIQKIDVLSEPPNFEAVPPASRR